MSIHLQREMDELRKRLLGEGALVEDAIRKAIRALETRDRELAAEVIEGDKEIDREEIEVEEECMKILALHQPVAVDLRFIVAALKMNNDLERMGDIAVSLARRADYRARRGPDILFPAKIDDMVAAVQKMIKGALDALVNSDEKLAKSVCEADDEVDRMKRAIIKAIRARMGEEPENLRVLLKMMDVPRHLERLADLATNIAEDVIYLVRGEIIRHHYLEQDGEQDDD
ncbi:phosphate signaling complex protein PhoU [bacterium]|nr:phosphate signaling complex protein PhoU [bacterium]